MNSRRKNDVDEYCVERQQEALGSAFKIMKWIAIGLLLLAAICVGFAIRYSL